jgi:hypothetical protein
MLTGARARPSTAIARTASTVAARVRTPARAPRAVFAAAAALLVIAGCRAPGGLFRQYEYEEEMYLALDGSATLYVNSSIAALNALRGTAFDASPGARVDRNAVRAYFTSPHTRVPRVSESRRSGRRFVHVRIEADDVRQLSAVAPFAWSSYALARDGDRYVYTQTVGAAAGMDPGGAGWTGDELTAFRMHLPSKIDFHNTPTHEVGRGNILTWEQPLAERLRGVPLRLEVRMETQSILYRTVWLFGITFVAVAMVFVAVIWWVLRKGRTEAVAS